MKKTLEQQLTEIQRKKKVLLIPYIMAGDGGIEKLEPTLHFLAKQGVSAIEIGIPFSDPVADGPVIQKAGIRALKEKVTLEKIIQELQKSTVAVPLIIMSYFNPIYHFGLEKFITEIKKTPVKGLIIPDLPYEHQNYIQPLLQNSDIALVPLVSLTSSKNRMAEISKKAEGFIYAVTVNGITGTRTKYSEEVDAHIRLLKSIASVPVLAGFGVATIEHVEKFAQDCDGVIIGSKIVQMLHEKQNEALQVFLTEAVAIATTKKAE